MHALLSRRITTGLALLVVLELVLTTSSVTRLAAHATPATAPIMLSKITGPPTTELIIKGNGFGSGETVITTFDTSTIVGRTRTSPMGGFSLGITIPATALPGMHSIQAMGQSSGLTVTRTFQVNTNWSQFGYHQAHSRTNPFENVLSRANVSSLTLDWHSPEGSNIFSSPAVAHGVVYIGASNSKVYALDARTGTRLWHYTTESFIDSSPAVADGVVYIGSYDDNLYALDALTGNRLWRYTTGSFLFSSPVVVNGVLYITSLDDNVYAFHLPDREP